MANTKITTSVITADAITGALIADDVALGGNPTTTTQSAGNDSTRVATTAFVTAAIDNLIDSAPGTMNTLNEIAAAINDDANFNTTVTNLIAAKAPLASPSFTGTVTVTGASSAYNTLQLTSNSTGHGTIINLGDTSDADYGSIAQFASSAGEGGRMRFIAGTTETMNLRGGKVGIGTSSPASLLHIKSTASDASASIILENTNNAQEMNIDYYNNAGAVQSRIGYSEGPAAFSFKPNVSATAAMYIDYNGKIGIGNTTPGTNHATANNLVVGSGAAGGMAVYNGTNLGWYAFSRDNANNTDAYDGGMSYDGSRNLTFHTNAGSARMTINGSGIVGVGTTDFTSMGSSSYKGLKVGGAVIQDSGGGNGSATWFGNNAYVGASNDFKHDGGGACSGIQMTSGDINFHTFDGGGGSADATWSPGTARMHIKENGYIGMGTTSPSTKLHVNSGSDAQLTLSAAGSSDNIGIFFKEGSSNRGELYWRGSTNDFRWYNYDKAHEQWVMSQNGKHEFIGAHQGDSVGHFVFHNDGLGDGTSTNCTLMVKNGNCQVQIMPWSTLGARIGTRGGGWSSNSNNAVHLTSNDTGNIILNTNGSPTLANGTAISSDERLKKNITDIANDQLAKINALKPRTFEWKDERKPGTQEGFIAQEVESVMPEAVEERLCSPDPDDTSRDFKGDIKVLKHEVMNARLIKAVQELSAKLEAAEARITTLEG